MDTQTTPQSAGTPDSTSERKVGFGLGAGILFMPYIFSWLTLRKGHTATQRFVAFAWLAVMVIAWGSNRNAPHTNGSGGTFDAPTPSMPTTSRAPALDPSDTCEQLAAMFGSSSRLSDLQKDQAWQQYEGKRFRWSLRITDVSETFGRLQVQATCVNSRALIQDVVIHYPDNARGYVMSLMKESVYDLEGTLNGQGLLGMTARGIVP